MHLAKVKSGHDKAHYYLIQREENQNVYLVNGTTKTLDHPKKKNRKHIQVIKYLPKEVEQMAEKGIPVTNTMIEKLIQAYEQHLKTENERF